MSPVDDTHNEVGVEDEELQMPNVFVTPPEEDRVPTWCCFDAANPSLSQVIERPEPKDISPIAFSSDQAYYSSMGYAATTTATVSVVDDAMAYQHPELDDDIETISDYGHELEDQDASLPTRDVANDSDVVEVVKLRRYDRMVAKPETVPQPSQTKRPKSLKSRASRAFKSLAGSLRSKSRTQDTVSSSSSRSSSQNESDTAQSQHNSAPPTSRSRTPTALRRGSGILSQLFTTPMSTRSSMSSFDEPALTSPTSPTHPKYSLSESSSSVRNKHLSSSSFSYETALQDQARLEAASPSPTTTSRKSSRRFSVLSLQKLFSFGPTTPVTAEEAEDGNLVHNVQPEEPDVTTTPVLRSVPSTPAFSSSSSNSGPETPTSAHYQIPVRLVTSSSSIDGAPDFPAFDSLDALFDSNQNLNLGLGLGLNLPTSGSSGQRAEPYTPRKAFSPSSSMWGSITPKGRKKSAPPSNEADTSLEMRLDSLHFDSLSFDIDRFSFK